MNLPKRLLRKSVRTKPTSCPFCHAMITAAKFAKEEEQKLAPTEGDVAVCWYCGEAGVYGENGIIRKPTAEETVELAHMQDVQEAIEVVKIHGAREPGKRAGWS